MDTTASNWLDIKFLLAPTDVVQHSQWIAEGDDLAILAPHGLEADLPNGDGPMARAICVVFNTRLNDKLVGLDEIEKVVINLKFGTTRTVHTQGLVTFSCCGLTCSQAFEYGDGADSPLTTLNLEVPKTNLSPARFPTITSFLTIAAQRDKSTDFFLFGIDAIDFRLWRK